MNAETAERLDKMEQKAFGELERKIRNGYYSDAAHCSKANHNFLQFGHATILCTLSMSIAFSPRRPTAPSSL